MFLLTLCVLVRLMHHCLMHCLTPRLDVSLISASPFLALGVIQKRCSFFYAFITSVTLRAEVNSWLNSSGFTASFLFLEAREGEHIENITQLNYGLFKKQTNKELIRKIYAELICGGFPLSFFMQMQC